MAHGYKLLIRIIVQTVGRYYQAGPNLFKQQPHKQKAIILYINYFRFKQIHNILQLTG